MSVPGRAKAALETLSTLLVIVAASGLVWTLFFKRPPEPPPPLPPVTDVNETIAAKHLTNVEGSGLNRPGFIGGLFPREDGAHGTTQPAFPGGT